MKKLILLFALLGLWGCGVKGKHQPPLYAPPMGRGKPTLNSNQQGIKMSPLLSPSSSNPGDSSE